jgi:branched-chain amino acid transport system permease protein
MTLTGLLAQLLNGLAEASSLFLVAAGLSLIFGVTRIVNFAHGSLYMLGLYIAVSLTGRYGASGLGFWACVLAASLIVGLLGALIEITLLRRIYRAPELFQLLATFALVLVINDAVLWLWGPEDLLGRRAPGLAGAISLFGRPYPTYSLLLIFIGPAVLAAMWWLLTRTRWGFLVRAARQDRAMLDALGVNQAWLFTSVFALGAVLAAFGGAVQLPREPASLGLDLRIIGDAFVVVVVGGLGSIPGAYVAALLIAEIKAVLIGAGQVELFGWQLPLAQLTLVAEFAVMAAVLVARPWGLFGPRQAPARGGAEIDTPLARPGRAARWCLGGAVALLCALPLAQGWLPYAPVLAADMLMAVLFAASLHFLMGPGGMASFGHAAYFGLGAYGAGVLVARLAWPMAGALAAAPWAAAAGALVFGWFCVRLSGVYLAMLTLAFAQIVWALVFQWDGFTGGSNGLTGLWPADWLSGSRYYYLVLLLVAAGVYGLRRMLFAPFGLAMRAARDSRVRGEAIGIDTRAVQWTAFVLAGWLAGLAGALYAFSKGSISPDAMAVGKSVDGLVMVLLGGVQALSGPIIGAAAFIGLQDNLMRATEYWRALLGGVILLLVLVFPYGLGGMARLGWRRFGRAPGRGA